jgi:hypothetical protein
MSIGEPVVKKGLNIDSISSEVDSCDEDSELPLPASPAGLELSVKTSVTAELLTASVDREAIYHGDAAVKNLAELKKNDARLILELFARSLCDKIIWAKRNSNER